MPQNLMHTVSRRRAAARHMLHLQWWRRHNQVNSLLQAHLSRESSGSHFGSLRCTRARGRAAECGGGAGAGEEADVVESDKVRGEGTGDDGRGACFLAEDEILSAAAAAEGEGVAELEGSNLDSVSLGLGSLGLESGLKLLPPPPAATNLDLVASRFLADVVVLSAAGEVPPAEREAATK